MPDCRQDIYSDIGTCTEPEGLTNWWTWKVNTSSQELQEGWGLEVQVAGV